MTRIIIQIVTYTLLSLGHRLAKKYFNFDAEVNDFTGFPKKGFRVDKPLVARRKTITVWYDC